MCIYLLWRNLRLWVYNYISSRLLRYAFTGKYTKYAIYSLPFHQLYPVIVGCRFAWLRHYIPVAVIPD